MKKNEFYFELPEELIAQHPLEKRDGSKLLHLNRNTGEVEDLYFTQIIDYLQKGDTLVINDTKVLPARLFGARPGKEEKIEVLLLNRELEKQWVCIVKPGRKMKVGTEVVFSDSLKAKVIEVKDDGNRVIEFNYQGIFEEILDELGEMPLPPYIRERLEDKNRYQTVYARELGSAAAPTAGLHFTKEILDKIRDKGINIVPITLHVGLGTFRPVKTEDICDHIMHSEHFYISESAANTINDTKKRGSKVIAVGTTSVRTLESQTDKDGFLVAGSGWTDIFIFPGYNFKLVDAIITNFHLPESTLVMLVSAFSKKEFVLDAYKHAINEKYRFFSFGDAMFID